MSFFGRDLSCEAAGVSAVDRNWHATAEILSPACPRMIQRPTHTSKYAKVQWGEVECVLALAFVFGFLLFVIRLGSSEIRLI